MAPKVVERSCGQPGALSRGDAGRRTAIVAARAQAHFREDQRVAVARDDVDLAAAATEVALDDRKAARDQEVRGQRLRTPSGGGP